LCGSGTDSVYVCILFDGRPVLCCGAVIQDFSVVADFLKGRLQRGVWPAFSCAFWHTDNALHTGIFEMADNQKFRIKPGHTVNLKMIK